MKTRKTITISINESLWKKLKNNGLRVSTVINKLLEEYCKKLDK